MKQLAKESLTLLSNPIQFDGNPDLLQYVSKEIDTAYQKDILNSALFDKSKNKPLKIYFLLLYTEPLQRSYLKS
jgi:hypothetical protein